MGYSTNLSINHFVKRWTVLMLFVFGLVAFADAQPFGNEWINYNQTYYKIKVTANGMYRIPFAVLNGTLPNLGSINPQNFALFHNGKAEPIYVSTNNPFGTNDYIDFYGRKNIGDIDSVLYEEPGFQPHPYYSIFTDTSAYFLTVNSQTNNPRFVLVANDTVSPLPAKQDYFWHTTRVTYTNTFFEGRPYYSGTDLLFKSLYDAGEGWGSAWISANTPFLNVNLPAPSIFTSGPAATIRACMTSRSNENHALVTTLNGNALQTDAYTGFQLTRIERPVALSLLAATNVFKVTETGGGVSSKQDLVHLAELVYPRKFEFDNTGTFYFRMGPSATKQRIDISNYNDGGTQPLLYDLTNGLIIKSTDAIGATPKKFIFPASANDREFFIRSDAPATITSIARMDTVIFVDYSLPANQGNYMIITNKKLTADSLGKNWVEEYRKYRDKVDNPTSGKYTARVYDVDQLYDQFSFGVKKNPLAIRNFIAYAQNKFSNANYPEYLFLIGKSREYQKYRTNAVSYNQALLPTFGFPGADMLLGGERGNTRPKIAIGRLAAEFPYQIADYLDKMQAYELQQNTFGDPYQTKSQKQWMKQILHFGGGSDTGEEAAFRYYLEGYQGIIEDTLWGTHVTPFYKTSAAPIQNGPSQAIKAQIDSGISLITFFGHAAATAFDISIDIPENYNNINKYPVILSNGCFTGFIHDITQGFSERFVFAPKKAAIGFIATSSLSLSNSLDYYSTDLYRNFTQKKYNQTIGKQMKQTARDIDSLFNSDDYTKMIAYEMTLHGDPGMKLNIYDKPDYEIDETSVYFNPTTIDAGYDTFEVNVITTNLGKAIVDTNFHVHLRRTIYDNTTTPATAISYDYIKKFPAPYYKDTFTFRVPSRVNNFGYGQNDFEILVESDLHTDELSETNNGSIQKYSTFIESDDVIPIYPYEFAIVPKQNVTLKASTVNPFAPLRTYQFQIDTTEKYNSPALLTGFVTQIGGVLHWKPSMVMLDSTVYYWRVSRDSTTPATKFNWHKTSFLYLKDEYPGWNQSHYYQYKRDNLPDYMYIDSDRVFKYVPNQHEIFVESAWTNAVGGPIPFAEVRWDYDNVNMYRYRMGGCGFLNGITFGVIDGKTFKPWRSVYTGTNFGVLGNFHCIGKTDDQFGFDFLFEGTHPSLGISWNQVIINFLDSVKTGDIVVMYSVNKPNWANMDPTLVARLVSMGAISLPSYKSGTIVAPYTFFCQKGNPAVQKEYTATDYLTPLTGKYNFSGRWNQGTMRSVTIGPAFEWGSVHWRNYALENQSSDKQSIEIYGVNNYNQEYKLLQTTTLDTTLTFIDAKQFPYIRLRYITEDDTTQTPAQLYYWRVLYKKVPEGAMNPAAYFKVVRDTVSLGDSLDVQIAFENVTDIPMDSMRTKYTMTNTSNGTTQNFFVKQDSLRGLDTLILRCRQPINSTAYTGLNKLVIEANPEDQLHQLEQFHFNNYASLDFKVTGDKINPLLDVTFDGRHIMNGDIVSAKPDIMITLKDENKYLALDDTALVKVYLKIPGQTNPIPYLYDNSTLTFYPPTGNIAKNNRARVEFKPQLINDGTYELLIQDRDKSGNVSSSSNNRLVGNVYVDYGISFEVVNKPMISNVLNYPNPFTTSTRFVFTITGSELPDYLKIQIMTITGKVVKEITKDELGPLYIGTNITQYAWNGRDEYGDLLANGVYFYRVINNLNNKQLDMLQSQSKYLQNSNFDKYFKKGFGKMVILR